MKKILTALITLLFAVQIFAPLASSSAFAKKNKKEEQQRSQCLQYLNLSWWEKYNDPILTGYIQELYDKNHDLKIAALKVQEGEQMVKVSLANELPQVYFDGNLGRVMRSSNQQFGDMIIPSYAQYGYQFPFTATYEIDIWGQNRIRTKSVKKQLEMIQQAERASYISLTSAFASNYFNLVKTDKLLEIQQQIVDLQTEIAKKTQKKFENGLGTVNEVIAEEKMLTTQKELLNNLEHTKTIIENQLKVYLADNSKEIARTDCDKLSIMQGLPLKMDGSVIEQRPDYIQSEDNIKKIGYDVRAARKDFLPKFIIYGQLGLNAYHWDQLFNSYSQLANAGIMPSFDLFSGGRKKAVLKLQKYRYEEARHEYEKAVLTGFKEVNDSTAQLKTDLKNYDESVERYNLEHKRYVLMEHKNQIGAASDLDLLYNKQTELLTKREEVSNKINCLISTISLYKATGGQDLYSIKTPDEQQEIKENI